jgi:hypothetical protein
MKVIYYSIQSIVNAEFDANGIEIFYTTGDDEHHHFVGLSIHDFIHK